MSTNASSFCVMVSKNPDISNATARFGAWLIGAAEATGGFPIELSLREIQHGFERKGVSVPGIGARYETMHASIFWLTENGLLTEHEGKASGFGHKASLYTLKV